MSIFSVTIQPAGKTPERRVVRVEGSLDETTIRTLEEKLGPLLKDKTLKILVLDFSALTFINSRALTFLLALHTQLLDAGRHVVVLGAAGLVLEVMTLIGLTSVIECVETI